MPQLRAVSEIYNAVTDVDGSDFLGVVRFRSTQSNSRDTWACVTTCLTAWSGCHLSAQIHSDIAARMNLRMFKRIRDNTELVEHDRKNQKSICARRPGIIEVSIPAVFGLTI